MKKKTSEIWIIYAIDRQNRQVVDLKTGKRTAKNVGRVVETLLLSDCERIYIDRLNLYKQLVPKAPA